MYFSLSEKNTSLCITFLQYYVTVHNTRLPSSEVWYLYHQVRLECSPCVVSECQTSPVLVVTLHHEAVNDTK